MGEPQMCSLAEWQRMTPTQRDEYSRQRWQMMHEYGEASCAMLELAYAGGCTCHLCVRDVMVNGIPYASTVMIVCSECGNKRCPKATDHNNDCTNSNAPGQPGSIFGAVQQKTESRDGV